jgi:hypothetical protein
MIRRLERRASRRAMAIAFMGAVVALGPSPAAGAPPDATGCMPPVVGIPWDGSAPSAGSLDDLRWNGSFAYQWATGTLRDGDFRNLLYTDGAGNRTLFVYYKNLVHRSSIQWTDGLQFGISYDEVDPMTQLKTKTVGQIVMLRFGIASDDGPNGDGTWTSPTVDAMGKPVPMKGFPQLMQQTTTYDASGNPTLNQTATPPGVNTQWLSNNSYLWILSDPGNPTNLYFVAQLAIPIKTTKSWSTDGLYVDPNQFLTPSLGIPFWGDEMTAEIPTTAGQVVRSWPDKTYTDQGRLDIPGEAVQPPSPDHWGLVQPAPTFAPPGQPVCTGGGLAFGPSDILNNSGYAIDLYVKDSSPAGYSPASNSFSVNVTNHGPAVTPSDIHATFRVAPFGSQDVRSASWQPLNTANNAIRCQGTKGDFATCNPTAATATAIDAVGAGGSSSFTVTGVQAWKPDWTYTCAINGDDGVRYSQRMDIGGICSAFGSFLPSANDVTNGRALFEHQCMMVELSTTNHSVQFDTQSQFRNMHVAHASHYEQKARIDSSGVPHIKGKNGHWMYLVLETRNMLRDIPKGIQSPYSDEALNRLLYGSCDIEISAAGVGAQYCKDHGNTPVFEYAAQYFPTTVVHVYHETGMHKTINRKKVAIYEPQASYGYFVAHDGMLFGWDVALKGAKKVRNNVYRVWIPDDGHVDVTTSIDALDKPRCHGGDDDDDDDHDRDRRRR